MVAVHTDKNELLYSLVIEFHLLSMPEIASITAPFF